MDSSTSSPTPGLAVARDGDSPGAGLSNVSHIAISGNPDDSPSSHRLELPFISDPGPELAERILNWMVDKAKRHPEEMDDPEYKELKEQLIKISTKAGQVKKARDSGIYPHGAEIMRDLG